MLSSRNQAQLSTKETTASWGKVKWFNTSKGFGFVTSEGFDAEFLLHRNVLNQSGLETAPEGSEIEFTYEASSHGLRVTSLLSIIKPKVRMNERHQDEHLIVSDRYIPARVKWFDSSKGYGFVNCFGCPEDVFIGSDVLRRAGFGELSVGQALCIQVAQSAEGRRVHQIHDWPLE